MIRNILVQNSELTIIVVYYPSKLFTHLYLLLYFYFNYVISI